MFNNRPALVQQKNNDTWRNKIITVQAFELHIIDGTIMYLHELFTMN